MAQYMCSHSEPPLCVELDDDDILAASQAVCEEL